MSDSKSKKTKPPARNDDIGRKIWLAGLGAYGQSLDNMQSGAEKINSESRTFFEKLVARGEEVESNTRKTINDTREKTHSRIRAQGEKLASKAEKIQNLALDNLHIDKLKPDNLSMESLTENINGRLDDIRSRIGTLVPGMVTREDIGKLSEKIEKLSAATRGSAGATKTASKKAVSKQNASKKSAGSGASASAKPKAKAAASTTRRRRTTTKKSDS